MLSTSVLDLLLEELGVVVGGVVVGVSNGRVVDFESKLEDIVDWYVVGVVNSEVVDEGSSMRVSENVIASGGSGGIVRGAGVVVVDATPGRGVGTDVTPKFVIE